MTEYQYLWIGVGKLIVALLIATIYSLAGRGLVWGIKVRRRVVLPLLLMLALMISAWMQTKLSLQLIGVLSITWVIYYGIMSVGYGEGSILRKWFGKTAQQFICGGLYGGGAILVGIYMHRVGLVVLNIILNSILLGFLGSDISNSEITASWKELLVGLMIFTIPLFLI